MDQLKVSLECFSAISEAMRPGNTLGDLMNRYDKIVQSGGNGDYDVSHPMMHARGLGDEYPAQFGDIGLEKYRAIELVSGMVFVVKPRVRSKSTKRAAQIGDTVVVRPGGGERLGKRSLQLRVV
jgi:Xaa-Pro aminopeptidase